jgi:hypothetical protein
MRVLAFERALETAFGNARSDFDATAWRPFLRSLDGKAPQPDQLALFEECTGRTKPFDVQPRTAQACCGRRSGKTRIAALVAATAAAFWNHAQYLSRGERGRIMLLSQSKDQAVVAKGYVLDLLQSNEVTAALITGTSAEEISLSNGIDIVIRAATFRGLRGFTCCLVLCDEAAFWRDSETSLNPAGEIVRAIMPSMATVPDPLLLSISSPFSKEGYFAETHQKHWGDNDSRTLCWQAASLTMNPTLSPAVVQEAYASDPQAAAAEYGAQFRSDIASFIDRDVVQACIETGRTQRGYLTGQMYHAFCDPSGGSKDSFTCAVAHNEITDGGNTVILDRLIEIKAPFDPSVAIAEVVALLKEFHLTDVTGDRYAGMWVAEAFSHHGVKYHYSMRDRSALYVAALPLLNSQRAQLLDNTRLVNQLCALNRRTGSSGKQSVDHPKNAHDDVANAAMGAVVAADVVTTQNVLGIGGGAIYQSQGFMPTPNPSYTGIVSISGGVPGNGSNNANGGWWR